MCSLTLQHLASSAGLPDNLGAGAPSFSWPIELWADPPHTLTPSKLFWTEKQREGIPISPGFNLNLTVKAKNKC